MALVFCDGFDSYAATADLTKKWASAAVPWTWNATAGKFGGGALVSTGSVGGGIIVTQTNLPTVGSNHAFGFYMKASAKPATTTMFVQAFGASNTSLLSLQLRASDGVLLVGANGTSFLPPTTLVNICDGNWHWIEVSGVWVAGSFSFSVWIDGISVATSIPGGGSSAGIVALYIQLLSVNGITLTIDDMIFWDGSGPSFVSSATVPIGPRQITTLRPISDGTIGFSTTSSGTTHFNLVNEVNPDGDTSYVEDSTIGDQDLLNFAALGYTPSTINAVMVNMYLKNPVGGSINCEAICKSGAASQFNAPPILTPLTYITLQWPIYKDPNTNAAWGITGLNAAQFGYKSA